MTESLQLDKEDTTCSTDEFLDWYCWCVATTGERFYPPSETADECIEWCRDEDDAEVTEYSEGVEHGQHGRAYGDAVEFFTDMKYRGFDPVMRAEREIERARNDDLDLPDMDWEWLEGSRYTSIDPPQIDN